MNLSVEWGSQVVINHKVLGQAVLRSLKMSCSLEEGFISEVVTVACCLQLLNRVLLLRYTELKFCLLLRMGVKLGRSQ